MNWRSTNNTHTNQHHTIIYLPLRKINLCIYNNMISIKHPSIHPSIYIYIYIICVFLSLSLSCFSTKLEYDWTWCSPNLEWKIVDNCCWKWPTSQLIILKHKTQLLSTWLDNNYTSIMDNCCRSCQLYSMKQQLLLLCENLLWTFRKLLYIKAVQ